MSSIRLIAQVVTAVVLFPATLVAAPVAGDYDGDGRADLSVAINYSDSSAWLTRLSGGGFGFWTFPVKTDAFISGSYFGNGRYYPGSVFVRDARIPLEWRIKTPSGGEVLLSYGLPGDTVPNQQDVDCDGITDFIVTRNGTPARFNGFKLWYIALSGSGGRVVETLFGLADDRPGLADMDADGCYELVVLRPGTYQWFSRKLGSENFTTAQWGLDGDIPLWPTDLNGDKRADYIIARRTGFLQQAFVRYGSGANDWETFTLGLDSSVPQVGNFLGTPFFTWHQRDTGWVALGDKTQANNIGQLHLFGVSANHIIRADGSVIPPNEDGRFPRPTPPPPPPGDILNCSTPVGDFIDGPGGDVWKPVSESTGRPVFLLPNAYCNGRIREVHVFDRNGVVVATGRFRTCSQNENRYHNDISRSASQLLASAPLTVQLSLSDGSRECRRVDDPTRRYD